MSPAPVKLIRTTGEFAEAFLARREAEHALLLALLADAAYTAVVRDGERVVAVAARTPPRNLLLSHAPPEAVDLLAHDLASTPLPGVVGPTGVSEAFAAAWCRLTGRAARRTFAFGLHAVEAAWLGAPHQVDGALRQAGPADRDLLVAWLTDFAREALGDDDRPAAERMADGLLGPGPGGLVLWEDGGRPVAMAGYTGPTPSGIRVSHVHAPPALRRRGYASALVAALTRRLLAHGYRWVFLTTDLTNLTSNALYRRLGYRQLGTATEWRFT